jgi:hypothetical protein
VRANTLFKRQVLVRANTKLLFKREAPALREKLLEAVCSIGAMPWQLLDRAEPRSWSFRQAPPATVV